jgi:hypothetical protein
MGAEGLLISGGCDLHGRVPLLDRVEEIATVHRSGLLVNLHTGALNDAEARALVRAEADCYSVDLVQDRTTIREVLHLDTRPEVYDDTLSALFSAGAKRVVPHVCIGLRGDDVQGEMASIDLASDYPVSALALLWHVPTKGTPLFNVPNASGESFLEVVRYAIRTLRCPVLIGCMRPRGRVKLELEAVRAGVAGVAILSKEAAMGLSLEGYEVVRSGRCCALHE